ncbi:MAG: SPASM domain-containing protein [Candidatus Nanoarchaeia archaeon]|nr:SPASM domain-containing protein [Candidatus Nanoarchaeia archaeon]
MISEEEYASIMREGLFEKPLKLPSEFTDPKVNRISPEEAQFIRKFRESKEELDPGMGGISPDKLDNLLKNSDLASVDIAITAACNFKCVHCYKPANEWGSQFFDIPTIQNIASQSADLGVQFFVITGGEPMIYRHKGKTYFDVVDTILEEYSKRNLTFPNILTFTDVALISPDIANNLAQRRIALCLKRDTLDPQVQDGILNVDPRNATQKMEIGYDNLIAAGYGKNSQFPASVNTVLRKGKFNTFKGSVDLHVWVRERGFEHSIVPIHYCGDAETEDQKVGLNALEVKALYDILAQIDMIRFKDAWTVYSGFPKNKTCNRPGRGVHIRVTGEVTACSESPKIGMYIFGNIKNESLVGMIKSKKFQEFRKEFSQRKGKYICNNDVCDLSKEHLCRGGCATRSAYSSIDPDTGLIIPNTNPALYSQGNEDPLCPTWMVFAQMQGVLKKGVYEAAVDYLLSRSQRLTIFEKEKIRTKIISDFNEIRGRLEHGKQ